MPKGYVALSKYQELQNWSRARIAELKQYNADKKQDWMLACEQIEDLKKENKRADELYEQATQRIDTLIEQNNKKQAEINQLKNDCTVVEAQRNEWKKVAEHYLKMIVIKNAELEVLNGNSSKQ
jgi:chromosome segregation ATPase